MDLSVTTAIEDQVVPDGQHIAKNDDSSLDATLSEESSTVDTVPTADQEGITMSGISNIADSQGRQPSTVSITSCCIT